MADAIDIMKDVVRRVINEEPELILDIIKNSLSLEVHHDVNELQTGEFKVDTEIVVELDEQEIYSTEDTFTVGHGNYSD